jgi:hypothetical protein
MPAAWHFAIEWPARSGTGPAYSAGREVRDGVIRVRFDGVPITSGLPR